MQATNSHLNLVLKSSTLQTQNIHWTPQPIKSNLSHSSPSSQLHTYSFQNHTERRDQLNTNNCIFHDGEKLFNPIRNNSFSNSDKISVQENHAFHPRMSHQSPLRQARVNNNIKIFKCNNSSENQVGEQIKHRQQCSQKQPHICTNFRVFDSKDTIKHPNSSSNFSNHQNISKNDCQSDRFLSFKLLPPQRSHNKIHILRARNIPKITFNYINREEKEEKLDQCMLDIKPMDPFQTKSTFKTFGSTKTIQQEEQYGTKDKLSNLSEFGEIAHNFLGQRSITQDLKSEFDKLWETEGRKELESEEENDIERQLNELLGDGNYVLNDISEEEEIHMAMTELKTLFSSKSIDSH